MIITMYLPCLPNSGLDLVVHEVVNFFFSRHDLMLVHSILPCWVREVLVCHFFHVFHLI